MKLKLSRKMKNKTGNQEVEIESLREDYIEAIRSVATRITKELKDEMNNPEPLITSDDRRFERVRGLFNDAPKTLETFNKILDEGSLINKKEDKTARARNGKKIGEDTSDIVPII